MKQIAIKLLFLGIFLIANILTAAETKWEIKGTVLEQETNEPIPYATVALYNKSDDSLITGAMSNDDGVFLLEKITKGDYYLKVSFMGYKENIINTITLIEANQILDLGSIILQPNIEVLEEVAIVAKRKAIKTAVDKQVLNVSSNLAATGGTAADALRLSPSIQVDSDNNIKLRGSGNFIVLINGKPTTLNAQDVLRQIPANSIKNIEVITNPSVKYNAAGGAGIINIILKKGYLSGLNGMVNASIGSRDKYTGDVTVNLNKEKVSYSFAADWRDYTKTANNNYYRTLFNENNTHYASMLQDRKITQSNLGFRFGVDYNPTEATNFNYSFHTGYNETTGSILNTNSGYTIPASTEEHKYNPFSINLKPTFFTNNLGYNKKLNDSGDNLSFNLYYSYIDYNLSNQQASYITDENQNIIDSEPYRLIISNKNNSNDVRFDMDFTKVFSEKTNLETGASYHLYNRFLNVAYSEFDYVVNDWVDNLDYTNKYNFDETVYAAYVNLNTSFWNDIVASVGLRLEYTDRLLKRKNSNERYTYNQANFFPGISLSKDVTETSNLKLALTNRINRPNEYMMNPFPEFIDDYFYSEGNPYLIPEIVRNLEFGYSYNKNKASLSSNLYYRTIKNKIDQKLTVEEDDKIHTMFHNDSGDKTIGLEIMYNFNVKDWWSINANVNLFYYDVWANIEGIKNQNDDFSWTSQLVNSFTINTSTSFQIIGQYASKTARSQGELSNYYFIDIALKRQFLDGRLSVNLQLKDALQSLNYKLKTHTRNMNLLADFNNESPIFLFNISYKFNNYKKKTKDTHTEFDM